MLQTNGAQPESISNNWCPVSAKIIYSIQQLCSNKLCKHTEFEERHATEHSHRTTPETDVAPCLSEHQAFNDA